MNKINRRRSKALRWYYRYHIDEVNTQILTCKNEYESVNSTLSLYREELKQNTQYFEYHTNYELEEILDKGNEIFKHLRFDTEKNTLLGRKLKQVLKDYFYLHDKQRLIKLQIADLKRVLIKREVYEYIVKSFYQQRVDLLVERGITFGIPGIGTLKVRYLPGYIKIGLNGNAKLPINWKESIAKRNQLISEGKTLYSQDPSTGEKWMVFFNTDHPVLYILSRDRSSKHLSYLRSYSFRLKATNLYAVSKLYNTVVENPSVVSFYERVDINW